MDNNSPNQHKIYRSDEIIERILKSLGLQRTDSSEYKTYTVDGKLLRVRVSDHGVNLSSWYRNNQGEEVPLNDSDNIAFTFLPNKEECAERGEEFRTTAINKTTVYSDVSTMTPIDFQFTVMHYIYQSWKFTEERLQALVSKIVEYTNSGKFEDPLHNTSAKATVFNDTSNDKPKKINCNRNMNKKLIRLTESDLHRIVKQSVSKILKEDIEWDKNGYPTNMPDDVSEWAHKLQNLCAELVQLKGKYRLEGEWDELLSQLEEVFNTLDGICADLNTYGMANHWSL